MFFFSIDPKIIMTMPTNIPEIKLFHARFTVLMNNHYLLVLTFYVTLYIIKQIFCLPGFGALNILAGSLFGLWHGLPIVIFSAGTGAVICYLCSWLLFRPLVRVLFSNKIDAFRSRIHQNRNSLFWYLLFVRAVPFSPHWFFNLASPVVDIPLFTFAVTTFLGYIPYAYITVQAGELIHQLNSLYEVWSVDVLITLVFIAISCLVPVITAKMYNAKKKTTKIIDHHY